MKFGIDCGHNCPPDTGCIGVRQEDHLTMVVGNQVMDGLKLLGYDVVNCTPQDAESVTDSLKQRCAIANKAKVDVFVSTHFNCFNGNAHGSEVFAMSETGRMYAQQVLDNICNLGFRNRGVKNGEKFFVIQNTQMPAILVECCFCDSSRDMKLFTVGGMAMAIIKGLTGEVPFIEEIDPPSIMIH